MYASHWYNQLNRKQIEFSTILSDAVFMLWTNCLAMFPLFYLILAEYSIAHVREIQ